MTDKYDFKSIKEATDMLRSVDARRAELDDKLWTEGEDRKIPESEYWERVALREAELQAWDHLIDFWSM